MAIIRNNNNNGTLTSDRRRDAFRGIIDRGEFQELSGSQQELLIRNTYAEADFGTYLYVLNNMKNMLGNSFIEFLKPNIKKKENESVFKMLEMGNVKGVNK